jgi:hypothetical protein
MILMLILFSLRLDFNFEFGFVVMFGGYYNIAGTYQHTIDYRMALYVYFN